MILNSPYITGSLTVTGDATIAGNITVTGSLSGTAATASLALNSNLLQGTGSVGFSTTASLLEVSSSQQQISASLLNVIANYATTGSNSFRANQSITGSLVVSSTITAQTLVVQTVTSSIVYSSGSNLFGSALGDRQTFTGSLNVTGSMSVTGSAAFSSDVILPYNKALAFNSISNQYITADSSNLYLGASNLARLTISSSGLVGIGTTNPTEILQTNGSIRALGVGNADISQLITDSSNSTTYRAALATFGNTAAGTLLGITRAANSFLYKNGAALVIGTGASDPLIFSTNDTEKMRITSGGNVGIGTSNPPSTQLAVVADWISGNATVKAYPITLFASGGASGYGIFDSNGTTRKAYIAANSSYVEVWGQQNTPMVLATNDIVRMNIDANGKITTPYQPAFYAYGVSGATYGSGNYWIFPSTTFNRGSHYNTSNGVFTAPVTGVYEFSFSNLGGTGNTVYRYFLYINNSQTQQGPPLQLRIDKSGDTVGVQYGTNFTKTVIVSLSTNDTVRIYYSADSGETSYPNSNDSTNEYSTFSGKLVG